MKFFEKWFPSSHPTPSAPRPAWADGSMRCLNAYIERDYSACVAAGREALAHQLIPTIGLVTILGMRRQGQMDEAEHFGRTLLQSGFGAGGTFLLFMMLLDGVLDPEHFLAENFFGGHRIDVTPSLRCQVYFY